ncbi:MAG: prepilin peptidase [Myxococcales bacterium]|nr:prepilin peptidase [Myxococcales bacterium]
MLVPFLIAAAVVAAAAAWTDWRTGQIPNWLTLGGLAAGVLGHLLVGFRLGGGFHGALLEAGQSLGGVLFCGVVPAFMWQRGAIGGGDVKLFAALGALCQPMAGLEVETYAFVAAALIAPIKLVYRGELLKTLGRSATLIANPFRKAEQRKEIPAELMTWFRLGPAIFLGAAATVLMHW